MDAYLLANLKDRFLKGKKKGKKGGWVGVKTNQRWACLLHRSRLVPQSPFQILGEGREGTSKTLRFWLPEGPPLLPGRQVETDRLAAFAAQTLAKGTDAPRERHHEAWIQSLSGSLLPILLRPNSPHSVVDRRQEVGNGRAG